MPPGRRYDGSIGPAGRRPRQPKPPKSGGGGGGSKSDSCLVWAIALGAGLPISVVGLALAVAEQFS